MRGRPKMKPETMPEDPKQEGTLTVTFVYNGTGAARDIYRKAIRVAQVIGQTFTAEFNGCPLPIYEDSTVNSLYLTHAQMLEIAKLNSEINALKEKLKIVGEENRKII